MKKSRIIYIFTWMAFAVLLLSCTLLLALTWNGMIGFPQSPVILILLWIFVSSSGIFLFMLAVKKAHRQWINEARSLKEEASILSEKLTPKNDDSKRVRSLDFSATARKLVRRIPEGASLEETGKELLKNLNLELEIMSGVFYMEKQGIFEAVSTFAMAPASEPYSFKLGEGLTGQAARNQQLMVLTNLPDDHLAVYSGLGKARPAYLAIVPLIQNNKTIAVLECSGYRYDPHDIETMFRIFSRDLTEKLTANRV